ncbi:MAG TPA: NUDIX hydrolase [Acidimicrobiales bacterium]|nr:NUDIX hydrolase [Acidimicrobiales bacterium]
MPEATWRRAAAYVLCRDDEGRILLTRFVQDGNRDSGKWTMPGGGMEWGEHPIETAARELEEETGYVADIGPILGVFSRWFTAEESARGEPGHVIGIVYEGTNLRGELRTEFSDTTDAAAWFTLVEARQLGAAASVGLVAYCLDLC